MPNLSSPQRIAFVALGTLAVLLAAPAGACTVKAVAAPDAGSVSPAAIKNAAVPAIRLDAGLTCPGSFVTVVGSNFIKAKFSSANGLSPSGGLVLKRADGVALAYTASADPNGSVSFTQDGTVDYMRNNLLDVLGLLNSSTVVLPMYLKPIGGALPAPGTYTDTITVTWNWYLCTSVGALGACLTTPNTGSNKTSVITVTLDVSVKGVVLTATTRTTWDPVSGTGPPRALPGSRRRLTVDAHNPDLVPLDPNSVAITVPLAQGESVAFGGDGTGPTVFTLSQGAPPSGLTLRYVAADSTSDDVDFSADGGANWAYAPVVGDAVSEAKVTHVRLRPQGSMAPGSRVSVSVPTVTR